MPISVPGHADHPFRDDGDAPECFPQGEVTLDIVYLVIRVVIRYSMSGDFLCRLL
jgi:hypothetical protein